MADDRYSWLDEETAERLLRGLPVDPPGGGGSDAGSASRPRAGAARAADTTGGSRPPSPSPSSSRSSSRSRSRSRPASGPGSRPGGAGPDAPGRGGGGRYGVPSEEWFEEADRRTAARLAAALDDLAAAHTAPWPPASASDAAPGAAPVELPGEAAALEAFRAARLGGPRAGSAGPAAARAGSAADLGLTSGATGERPGQDGAGTGRERGRSRTRYLLTGRPLRAGFAVAVAGCALGGVAVAAGTGVLPTPFTGGGTPAATVSPAATPTGEDPEASSPGDDEDAEGRDTAGDERRTPRETDSGGPSHDDGGHGDGKHPGDPRDLANSGGGGKHDKDGGGHKDNKPGKKPGKGLGDSDDRKEAIAVALCKAYTANKLEADDRKKLERAAGGRAVVRKFCIQYGHSGGSTPGGGDGGGQGGTPGGPGDGDDGSDGSEGSDGSDGSTGGGSHPSVPGDDTGDTDTGGVGGTGGGDTPSAPADPGEGSAGGVNSTVTGATSGP
ncbi:hypothetical protein MMF93_20615 [Streptomyces tubbatahanensis]|uniref:Uncharacterized protein n=1 Tax=Streptomyces tubbatahanensis TaxID=2923272 RepID=A0ABY3XVS0_9ACTN|nr:hypothetical protein [Streptomyces tubbatahanensis]UNS98593.1 hypothetical protein MMF93_20615 [Streptomyces tubbatahanensis]